MITSVRTTIMHVKRNDWTLTTEIQKEKHKKDLEGKYLARKHRMLLN
jgi:hypothetical protein